MEQKNRLVKTMRNRRQRGYYAERALTKLLRSKGYKAVRIPVSNPSLNPLPDIFAAKNSDIYAFEVKAAKYYIYVSKKQITKLFQFLEMIPVSESCKHAILAGHFGKKWKFKQLTTNQLEQLPTESKIRLTKRDKGNWVP